MRPEATRFSFRKSVVIACRFLALASLALAAGLALSQSRPGLPAAGGGPLAFTKGGLLSGATATVSGDATLCAGQSTPIQAVLTGTSPWALIWSDGISQSGLTASTVVRDVRPTETTTYTVTSVTDADGAGVASGSAVVTVNGVAPSAVISAPLLVSPGQGGLEASVPEAGVGATYDWVLTNASPAAVSGTRTITFTAGSAGPATLAVTVTAGSCTSSATRSLTVMQAVPTGPLAFTTLAGLPAGNEDGPKTQAHLSYPSGVAVDGVGNVYVSDQYNHKIRRVAPDGSVTTIAGCGTASADDGPGARAMFTYPVGIARDAAGNLYVADQGNNQIRKVAPDGTVTRFSGFWGGFHDGPATVAQFSGPSGVAVDGDGNVYVADSGNNRIRKVTPDGTASTIAGDGTYGYANGPGLTAQFRNPKGVAVDVAGNVYVADKDNNRIRKVAPDGNVSTLAGDGNWGWADGTGDTARFGGPTGVALDGSGNVVVADEGISRIRMVAPDGDRTVSTLAGSGTWGYQDGPGTTAQFRNPVGVAVDGSGNVVVADSFNNRIRMVAPDKTVTTLTGNGTSSFGFANGSATDARFGFPMGLTVTSAGDTFFPDQVFNRIRKVAPDGVVTTVAGNGSWGYVDGPGATAEFRRPLGVAQDGYGSLVVADASNNRIRRVAPDGSVSTIAGDGNWGFVNGPAATARFANPAAVAVDGAGNVYVGEWGNHAIRKITPDGIVSTLAGDGQAGSTNGPGATARFNDPNGLVFGTDGNLYVADQWNAVIRKVTPDGTVSTFAGAGWGFADGPGTEARFRCPYGITADALGNLYVADQWNHRVRKVAPDGTVSTVAGSGAAGGLDGTGTSAQFSFLTGVSVGSDGALYVMDTNNNAFRVGRAASVLDAATIDAPLGTVLDERRLDTSPRTAASWLWQQTGIPPGSAATLSSLTAPDPTFVPDAIGAYSFRLTATAAGGAQGITEVRLQAYVPPTATVSGGGTICAGLTATVQAALTGAPPWSLTWSDGEIQSGITASPAVRTVHPTATTVYSVTGISDYNATGTSSGTATVVVNAVPEAPFVSAPASVPSGAVGLVASVAPRAGSSWSWSVQNGSLTSGDGTHQITFTAETSGAVTLTAVETSAAGCVSPPGLASVSIAEAVPPHVVNQWESVGPDGGEIQAIEVDPSTPSTVWSTTFSGAFKSTDGGGHWAKMWSSGNFTYGLAVHPTNGSVVFISDRTKRVYKSTNGGLSWSLSSTGLPPVSSSSFFGRIRFKPGDPSVLYYAWQTGLFKSIDSGATWTASDAGAVNAKTVLELVVDPASPDTVYLALSQFGVYKSTDGGATWGPASTGLPTQVVGSVTQVPLGTFAMDPSDSQRIYVGSNVDGGLYLSTDGGATWTARPASSLVSSCSFLRVAPGDGQTLYCGATDSAGANPTRLQRIFKSTDGGGNWSSVSDSIWSAISRPLAIPLVEPSTLYALMGGRVWKTTDAGVTWQVASAGLRAAEITGVSFSLSSPSTWYANAVSLGIFRTTDGGSTLSAVNRNLISGINGTLVVDPGNPQVVLAAGRTKQGLDVVNTYTYLVRSTDGGATWNQVPNVAPSPENPSLQPYGLLALPTTPTTFFVSSPWGGVYKSTDGGATFVPKNTGLPAAGASLFYDIVAADAAGVTLFVAAKTGSGRGLYRSTNGGENWTLLTSGLPAATGVEGVAVHPAAPHRVFTFTVTGVLYSSADAGDSWAPVNGGFPATLAYPIAIAPSDASVIVVAGSDNFVPWIWRSTDGGATWSPLTTNGLDTDVVTKLAIDPADPNHIIAGGRGGLSQITLDPSDAQGNGIPDTVEAQVPSLVGAGTGDGNGDGVPDADQVHVASLPGPVPGEWVTVEAINGNPLSGVAATSPPAPSGLPPEVTAPSGVVQFTVGGVPPGGCEVVTLYFPKNPAINGYFKYGPTPENTAAHWYNFAFDGLTGAGIFQDPDRTRIVLHLCDGLRGDGDLTANGSILDPGGPIVATGCSTPATPVPTNDGPTCEGGTVNLAVDEVAGATYSWTGPNGFVSSQRLVTLSNVVPGMTGDYFVNVTDGACTSAVGTTAVVVNPKPLTPVITAPSGVGPGQSFTASVPDVAGVSYAWVVGNGTVTAGSGTRQITVTAGETGPVTISVTETYTATTCVSAEGSVAIPVALLATSYHTVTPCRLFDTRLSDGPAAGAPILAPGETRPLSVGTRCGLSSTTIRSLAVNVTVTTATADGELVLFRGDLESLPITSNISYRAEKTRANNGILELSRAGDGTFKVHNRSAGSVHFILDVNGTLQ